MDDTLLNDEHQISVVNHEKLMEAQRAGLRVVLASGRPTPAMLQYGRDLKLGKYQSHLVAYNGGVILDMANEQEVFAQQLTVAQIHQLYDYAQEAGLNIMTYTATDIITPNHCQYVTVEQELTNMRVHVVEDFKAFVQQPAVKCIIVGEPDRLKATAPLLRMAHPDKSVAISKPFFLEVTQQGIDKAASIDRLAKSLNIGAEEVIAVGNAGNDLSMVEYAGLGVWVENVDPALRDRADVIVASNNDHGVAEVIDRFVF
ncbi:Cof-type HAD-IIB family hydrolase [Persicobacter psychrovividus]